MRIDGANGNGANYNNNVKSVAETISTPAPAEENIKTAEDRIKDGNAAVSLTQYLIKSQKGDLSISEKALQEAIDRANKAIVGTRREFQYSIHQKTHEISIKVIDSESKEVVREIPPEKMLDLLAGLWELAGILVDEKR